MSTKAIQNILIGLIFATLIIPFLVLDSSYFPYIVGKAFIFRTIVSLMIIFWSWIIFRDSKFLPTINGIFISFSLLVLFYLISAFLGESLRDSIFSNFERMMGWFSTFFLYMFFLISASVMKSKELWNKLFFTQICTSLVLFLIAIGELAEFGINFRIDATLGNPIYLSVIFLFSIFFAAYLLFEDYHKWTKVFLIISIFINSLGVFFSGTRGSMVGIFIATLFLVIALTIAFWKNKTVRLSGIIFLAFAILIPTLLFSFKDSSFIKNNNTLTRITQINIVEGTGYARFVNWGIAVEGIKERPIWGWGQENYSYVFDKYYDARMYAQEAFFDSPHNTVLDVLVHGGILSLLAYLSIFVFAIILILKKESISKGQKIIFLSLLIAYFIQNLFVFDNITSLILFSLVLSFAVSSENNHNKERKLLAQILASLGIIISITLIIFTVLNPWRANINLINGLQVFVRLEDGTTRLKYTKGLEQNQNFFEEALKNNKTSVWQIKFASINVIDLFRSLETENEKIKDDMINFINFSVSGLMQELDKSPDNAKTLYATGLLLSKVKNYEQAEKMLEKAVEISPNRQHYLQLLAEIKRMLNKDDEYLEILKTTYEVERTNDNALLNYMIALSAFDKESFSIMLKTLIEEGSANKVFNLFDLLIKNDPDNLQVYINKTVFLAQAGEFELAIEMLDIIDQKFPDHAVQTKIWRDKFVKKELPE